VPVIKKQPFSAPFVPLCLCVLAILILTSTFLPGCSKTNLPPSYSMDNAGFIKGIINHPDLAITSTYGHISLIEQATGNSVLAPITNIDTSISTYEVNVPPGSYQVTSEGLVFLYVPIDGITFEDITDPTRVLLIPDSTSVTGPTFFIEPTVPTTSLP